MIGVMALSQLNALVQGCEHMALTITLGRRGAGLQGGPRV